MKTRILAVLSLVALLAFPAMAQTSTNGLWSDVLKGLGSITNYAVAPYITYAPDAPKKVGGGVLAIYNLNNYVGAGIGLDWLGQFSLVSANVQLKLPLRPFSGFGLPNVVTTPFVLAGIGTPYGGSGNQNGNVSTIQGAGLALNLFKIKSIDVGFGYAFLNWTGAGDYSGRHHEGFLTFSKGF